MSVLCAKHPFSIIRQRIHSRIRRKVAGTPERPRLAVYFSNQHVYAQLIDDSAGRTLVSASLRSDRGRGPADR